jgi:hypothetical protein
MLVDPREFHLIVVSEELLDFRVVSAVKELGWKRMTSARRRETAKRKYRALQCVLAHEIAHAFIDDTYSDRPEDVEAEAERLASEWGFDGPK